MDKVLTTLYFDPSHPAGYAGVRTLYTYARKKLKSITVRQVKDWLQNQKAYSLHKPIRRRFPRRKTVVAGLDQQWQADLADVQSLSQYNDQYRYLLCILDVFSRYAWVIPLKDKKGSTLVEAFRLVFKTSDRKPESLQTDKGSEFKNATFQSFLKQQGIHYFTSNNPETKASLVERFQRTLKGRMWKYFTHQQSKRYVDDLQSMVTAYNHRVHRSIKTKPALVNEDNEVQLSFPKPKVKPHVEVGQFVRLNKTKHTFQKGYLPNWTTEIFKVTHVNKTQPPTLKVEDLAGEAIQGTFYEPEVQVIKEDTVYEIESVLARRTRKVGKKRVREIKVHWKGYPKKFDSWIPESHLV